MKDQLREAENEANRATRASNRRLEDLRGQLQDKDKIIASLESQLDTTSKELSTLRSQLDTDSQSTSLIIK